MSYCYADDDTSDPVSPTQQHYHHHLMPESPLQHKLSTNHSTTNRVGSNMSPNSQLEHEKRVRREIANSNERRRMQSINTGFQSLKILIPHSCGEKLSKACILQRAADHIKSLETEKLKLQSQNEQFRILIKSFQIDSTSVLQAQRRLSTNDPDESILLLNNETKSTDDLSDDQLRLYHDMKSRHAFVQNWHDVTPYVQTTKEEPQPTHYYSTSSSSSYRTTPKQSSTSDTTYMIVKPNQPSQRCYKTNSLDQTNENGIVIVERCQLRAQSVDTNNNNNNNNNNNTHHHLTHHANPSSSSDHTVSRRNLQTIVEAIRHLEGDDALANINLPSTTSQQEDLPAQLKAMINEKFQQQTQRTSNAIYQQTISAYDQQQQQQHPGPAISSTAHEIDLHQKPPKKRKITYNENDDTIEQQSMLQKQDLPPISSPDVHHHEQISSDSPPPLPLPSSTTQTMISNLVVRSPPTVAQLLQEHLQQRSARYPPPPLLPTNLQRHQQQP